MHAEEIGPGRLRIRLQCGQCGAWRRATGHGADLERHERALRRDRTRLGNQAVRLAAHETQRRRAEFLRVLRSEVVGPDDFIARARPASSVHRRGDA
jgi:hypothetical protein